MKECWPPSNHRSRDFTSCNCLATFAHRNVVVVLWHVDKSGQALAEPHGDLSVHVDSKRFEALLKATHGVVLEGAGIFAQVHATHLSQTKAADRDEP